MALGYAALFNERIRTLRRPPLASAIVLLGLAGIAAAATPNAKPGLAKMPAEAREKLLRSMSPQGGKPTVNGMRQCVTPEMVERWDAFASGGSDSSCRRTVVDQSAQRVTIWSAATASPRVKPSSAPPGRIALWAR
jgi:hypothetical protein